MQEVSLATSTHMRRHFSVNFPYLPPRGRSEVKEVCCFILHSLPVFPRIVRYVNESFESGVLKESVCKTEQNDLSLNHWTENYIFWACDRPRTDGWVDSENFSRIIQICDLHLSILYITNTLYLASSYCSEEPVCTNKSRAPYHCWENFFFFLFFFNKELNTNTFPISL